MKKLVTAFLPLALVASLASCELFGTLAETKADSQPAGTTWELKTVVDPVNPTSNSTMPSDVFAGFSDPDIDLDGTIESAVLSIYMRFDNGTVKMYKKVVLSDGGTDTTTLASLNMASGLFTDSAHTTPYTLSGTTFIVNGKTSYLSISGSTMTIVYGTQTSTYVAVTSPTEAEFATATGVSFFL